MIYAVLAIFALSIGCVLFELEVGESGLWILVANLLTYLVACIASLVSYVRAKRKSPPAPMAPLAPVFWVALALLAITLWVTLPGSIVANGPFDDVPRVLPESAPIQTTLLAHPSLIPLNFRDIWLSDDFLGQLAVTLGILLPLVLLISVLKFWSASARPARDKAVLAALVVAALLISWSNIYDPTPPLIPLDVATDIFRGDRYLSAVVNAKTAKAIRLHPKGEQGGGYKLERYVQGESVDLNAQQLALVKSLLSNPRKYVCWPAVRRTRHGVSYAHVS